MMDQMFGMSKRDPSSSWAGIRWIKGISVCLRRSKGVATLMLGYHGAFGVTSPSNCVFVQFTVS